jgi:hypothetical protein
MKWRNEIMTHADGSASVREVHYDDAGSIVGWSAEPKKLVGNDVDDLLGEIAQVHNDTLTLALRSQRHRVLSEAALIAADNSPRMGTRVRLEAEKAANDALRVGFEKNAEAVIRLGEERDALQARVKELELAVTNFRAVLEATGFERLDDLAKETRDTGQIGRVAKNRMLGLRSRADYAESRVKELESSLVEETRRADAMAALESSAIVNR